jgi:LuxR family maltose regulon positive regulatory protein
VFYNGFMPAPILATKLYIPPPRPKVVSRPRLIERLNEGKQHPSGVTLISAPAGFGKTTLVSEWIAALTPSPLPMGEGLGVRAAWLSLDEGDNDLTRFLTYLVAALQTIAPKVGEATLALLQSSQPPPTEVLLTALLNDLTTLGEVVLVLDDYHAIESAPIDEALTFLVDHLPPQLRLVIASREDPPLPLARLRARGQLTELRAADLRFTPAEAADFLNDAMSLNLAASDIAALESRTEGWIAGLQLAALSMQGRSDTTHFIQAFTGSHRFVLDYLMEEVLQRQPERVRSFLLQTAILERLCGSLCDAVTNRDDGRSMLELLERSNLFVVPLDDRRQWWRYHHLFADVLQARLIEEQSDRVSELHRRASEWFEQNNLPAEAIHHALIAKDFERAAALIEMNVRGMRSSSQEAIWLGWVKALPGELVHMRPVLLVYYAFALLPGEPDAAEERLKEAERWLDTPTTLPERSGDSSRKPVVVNEEEFRSLPGTIAVARAYRAGAVGDVPGIVQQARRALDLLPDSDHLWRGGAAALLGIAYWNSGDLEAAHRAITEGMTSLHLADGLNYSTSASYLLADIRLAQGRLREAVQTSQRALQLVAKRGEPMPQGTADLHVVLSEVYLEQNDVEAARRHLAISKELGIHAALTEPRHRWYVAMAHLKEIEGNFSGALELLDEAERQYIGGPTLEVHPIAALRAQVWLRQGKLAEALEWAHAQGLSADDMLSYWREFEHITLARVLIAQYETDRVDGSLQAAQSLLARLLPAAEEYDRTRSLIEILVMQALAYRAQDDPPHACAALERALSLAEPEGFVRLFVAEGEALRLLILDLRLQIEKRGSREGQKLIGYADMLLMAFAQPITLPQSTIRNLKSEILEPLSERELEVLKLLGTELSGPEIADRLSVSLNTLRTHTKNIYSKLGVSSRRAALRRAEELGLL